MNVMCGDGENDDLSCTKTPNVFVPILLKLDKLMYQLGVYNLVRKSYLCIHLRLSQFTFFLSLFSFFLFKFNLIFSVLYFNILSYIFEMYYFNIFLIFC